MEEIISSKAGKLILKAIFVGLWLIAAFSVTTWVWYFSEDACMGIAYVWFILPLILAIIYFFWKFSGLLSFTMGGFSISLKAIIVIGAITLFGQVASDITGQSDNPHLAPYFREELWPIEIGVLGGLLVLGVVEYILYRRVTVWAETVSGKEMEAFSILQ